MTTWWANRKKASLFGSLGAAGGLLGAIVAEVLMWLLAPAAPPPPAVDVLFLLDVTSSMQPQIDGVRKGITQFADALSNRKLNARVGLVAYRDRIAKEEPQVLKFETGTFTSTMGDFEQQVKGLQAAGGGDLPESTLDAVVLGAGQDFRPEATRVIVLITDAPPHIPDKMTKSVAEAAGALRQGKIDQLHLVIQKRDQNVYHPLQESSPGELFLLEDIAGGVSNFDSILPVVGEKIAEQALKSLQSTAVYAGSSYGRLLLIACLWTALLALGVSLALIGGQNMYLHRPILDPKQAVAGTIGGLAAGIIAGGAGQLFFSAAASIAALEFLGRIAGWGILGALVGWGMSYFVPNLGVRAARIGGGIGGALAALGFVIAAAIVGQMLGRFVGAAILGFCLGIMIVLVEAATRTLWLEVRYGEREIINVTLGATPVTIGSNNRACMIYAREARPLAFQYKIENGNVVCVDYAKESSAVVVTGDQKQIGNVVVTVRAGAQGARGAAAAPAAFTVPLAPPPPPPPRAAASRAPVPAPPPAPRPAPSQPVPQRSVPAGAAQPIVVTNSPPPTAVTGSPLAAMRPPPPPAPRSPALPPGPAKTAAPQAPSVAAAVTSVPPPPPSSTRAAPAPRPPPGQGTIRPLAPPPPPPKT